MPDADASPTAAERQRHDVHTTLTVMRLQTQLLLRVARRLDGADGEQLVRGLVTIDEGISTVVDQLAPPAAE